MGTERKGSEDILSILDEFRVGESVEPTLWSKLMLANESLLIAWYDDHCGIETIVPCRRKAPTIVAPPFGTSRLMPPRTVGQRRNSS